MNRMFALLMTAVWCAQPALAASDPIPESFLIGAAAADFDAASPQAKAKASSIEKAQQVPGTTYTIVAPIFLGGDGNLSHLRLGNGNDQIVSTSVTVVGYPSLRAYGTANIQLPARSSPQYPINDILVAAGAPTTLPAGETGYSLYLRSSGTKSTFQHVIYSSTSKFFENMSICAYEPLKDYTGLNGFITNVHTSILAATYPSLIYIHNFLEQSVDFSLQVYDARTGALKGIHPTTAAANSTYAIPMTFIEQQIGWVPGATDFHANILVQGVNVETVRPYVGQFIFNATAATYVNMSQSCLVNR